MTYLLIIFLMKREPSALISITRLCRGMLCVFVTFPQPYYRSSCPSTLFCVCEFLELKQIEHTEINLFRVLKSGQINYVLWPRNSDIQYVCVQSMTKTERFATQCQIIRMIKFTPNVA